MKTSLHWAQMEERGVIWGMRLLLRVYLLFGRTVLQVFLYPVVIYYWLINRPARDASRAYLDRLAMFAPELKLHGSLYWSYRHFISFANAIIDKLAAWSGALTQSEVIEHGREELLAELKKGRGVLLLGAHLGNLEVCRIIADFDKTIHINVLVHTKHAQKFNKLLQQSNENSQLNIIQVTEITAATAQLLYDKIEAGELVIMAADRTPVSNRQRVSKASFLGAEAWFPQGPFILAGLLLCPVYTLFCLKQQGKFVIHFEPFSASIKFQKNTRELEMQSIIQRYAQRLQDYCLNEPLQWFNFYDFWQDSNPNDEAK
jgi:predicted LPLAT superfamily acyltransferase